MIQSKNAEVVLNEAMQLNNNTARQLGYLPWNNLSAELSQNGNEVDLKGDCPLCGNTTHFKNIAEVGMVKNITNPNSEVNYFVNCCPTCEKARQEGLEDEKLQREINTYLMKIVNLILKDKFGANLICTKTNMFTDPNELITFKKDGEKYRIPLKTIMVYGNHEFEDTDDEFKHEGEEPILDIVEDDTYAVSKTTGDKVFIEDFLLNKDRDSEFGFEEEEDSDDVSEESVESTIENSENEYTESTEETNNSEIVENPTEESVLDTPSNTYEESTESSESISAEEETKEETSTVDESKDDLKIEVTEIPPVEIPDPEPEPEKTHEEIMDEMAEMVEEPEIIDVPPIEDTKEEEKSDDLKIEVTEIPPVEIPDPEPVAEEDSSEITDEALDESMFTEPEIVDIPPIKEEEKSTESFDNSDEIEIDFDSGNDNSNTENSNPFFNFFNNNTKNEETKVEENNTNKDNDDEIEIEFDDSGSSNPFSVASEVESKEDKVSPIISEARKEEQKDEITEDSSEKDIEIEVEINNNNKKDNKEETIEDIGLDINHKDRIYDEAKKQSELDKKWYNNPVFVETDHEVNEFMDEVDLIEEFKQSKLGKVIYEVSKRTGIEAQFVIDENTYEIPVVDFKTGVRIICIDCDAIGQMKVHTMLMERNIPFHYELPKGVKYRKLCLYSDSLQDPKRVKATIRNLIKNVNRDKFDGKYIVNLAGNYTLFYTDYTPTIRAFEEENSSYPQGKPCTKSIGIIALRSSTKKKEEFTAKDFMNFLNKDYKMDMRNHNLYLVASARYIVQVEPERHTVKYIITEYNELSTTILKDGLDHIVGAILKEHKLNNTVKDPRFIGTDFSQYNTEFEYEFDPSTIPSPSLEIWYDKDELFTFPSSFEDGQGKCYIRSPEYREKPSDGYRKDPRLFLPIPFSKMFKAEIQRDGVNILNDKVRRQYIDRLGFVEAYYPRMKRLIMNPMKIMKLNFSSSIFGMTKVDLNKFFSGTGIYDGGYDNILMQKFLNSSNLDPQIKNFMSAMMIQNMMNKNQN